MIEVEVDQAFPDCVRFYNEKGGLENATLNYEWLPIICSNCKKMGHHARICYTEKEGRKLGQVWRRKAKETELETTNLYPKRIMQKINKKRGQGMWRRKGVTRSRTPPP
ncbi:putative phospholipase B-like lamina ancestor [Bienertia sinuspersici]